MLDSVIGRLCMNFWRNHIAFIFHISCVSALAFVYLWPSFWLEVLLSCILSIEVFNVQARQGYDRVEVQILTTG
jgi:biotin transporter BioY